MIKVILVDDEKPLLMELEYILSKETDIKIMGTFTDPAEAIESIAQIRPDAVFLDIEMPVINGLNAAVEILSIGKDIEIIFVTAFNEYAIKAFEVNALDYLLKPVSRERLTKSLNKIREIKGKKSENKTTLINTVRSVEKYIQQDIKKIIAWDEDEIVLLKPNDIMYIETDSGNSSIITKNKKYKTKNTMEVWEERLEDVGFFRCHRCYIINLKHITKISPMFNNYIITLEDCEFKIPLSRNNVKKLKSILGV